MLFLSESLEDLETEQVQILEIEITRGYYEKLETFLNTCQFAGQSGVSLIGGELLSQWALIYCGF
jgi:hypothetical protein